MTCSRSLDALLEGIDSSSFRSRQGGCLVILATCVSCGRVFEELVVAAKAKAVTAFADDCPCPLDGPCMFDINFLCLACDPQSLAPACVRVLEPACVRVLELDHGSG